jgi:hypothetical protein
MAPHQIEKVWILLLDGADYFILLLQRERSKVLIEALAADCFSILQAIAIGNLVAPEVANKLLIDISENTSLRGTGKIVCGDDLIADCGQSAGLCVAQKIPIALPARGAAYCDCRASQGPGGYELASRQKYFARLHRQIPSKRTHPEQGSHRNCVDIC